MFLTPEEVKRPDLFCIGRARSDQTGVRAVDLDEAERAERSAEDRQ